MNIKYSIVKKADKQQIITLYKQAGWWTLEEDGNDSFVEDIIKNTHLFAIAKQGEQIIGMGRAISEGVSDAYIQDVTVLKEYRKKGIGGTIIKLLVNKLRSEKIGWIGLISEPGADKFYTKLGFEQMKGYTPFLYKGKDSNCE
ncbi:MAG: GNAT family N-acetyltransferase [Candidatus Delongbacteria bacterium]|nr:GNAT family N-acetyltransferase [Candidatus Delongbacteria bacterium]MCG2761518.1 GNAT family N-acetyltransferase [Candidatus Delongbacteria bacterium]